MKLLTLAGVFLFISLSTYASDTKLCSSLKKDFPNVTKSSPDDLVISDYYGSSDDVAASISAIMLYVCLDNHYEMSMNEVSKSLAKLSPRHKSTYSSYFYVEHNGGFFQVMLTNMPVRAAVVRYSRLD